MLVLKPSAIHGVGVFTTTALKIGERLPMFARRDYRCVERAAGYALHFAEPTEGGYYIPAHWERMSIGWYLNHSMRPNVHPVAWRVIRHVRGGEEVTIDYHDLERGVRWVDAWLRSLLPPKAQP